MSKDQSRHPTWIMHGTHFKCHAYSQSLCFSRCSSTRSRPASRQIGKVWRRCECAAILIPPSTKSWSPSLVPTLRRGAKSKGLSGWLPLIAGLTSPFGHLHTYISSKLSLPTHAHMFCARVEILCACTGCPFVAGYVYPTLGNEEHALPSLHQ